MEIGAQNPGVSTSAHPGSISDGRRRSPFAEVLSFTQHRMTDCLETFFREAAYERLTLTGPTVSFSSGRQTIELAVLCSRYWLFWPWAAYVVQLLQLGAPALPIRRSTSFLKASPSRPVQACERFQARSNGPGLACSGEAVR